jgi:hypothetical protein
VYVDGGFLCNYPLQQCIDQIGNPDEIFGLNKKGFPKKSPNTSLSEHKVESSNGVGVITQDKALCREDDSLRSPDITQNAGSTTEEYKNITEYLLDILAKTVKKLIVEKTNSKYTMEICDTKTSVWGVYDVIKTKETRAAKIQYGAQLWREWAYSGARYN